MGDGGSQPPQALLEQVIRGAPLQRGDGGFVSDRRGNDDEGSIQPALLIELERTQGVEPRQIVIGDDELRLFAQRLQVGRLLVHALPFWLEVRAPQLSQYY